MNQQKTNFNEICLKSIFCQDKECQLDHSRSLVGVCIEYLRKEQQNTKAKDCNIKDCKLWHFNQNKLKKQKNTKTINGIYPHNLCPQNCKSKDCKFLHREWADKVCLSEIVDECKQQDKCELNHVDWDQLEEKAKSCSIIQDITPEVLSCDNPPIYLKDYCIPYLKGQCPKNGMQCRNHFDWENINPKFKLSQSIKSCITIVEEKNKQTLTPFNTNDVALLCKESEFLHYKKWFHEQNIIDVVFIMDLTGSMKPWKELMQNTISKIIDQFLNSVNGYQVRVAFVGYRDICDKEEQLIYWCFTNKVAELQKYIQKLETKGGGDNAEDVVSGFKQALQLNFSHHPDSILCTFLLADAPCHGRNYHKYLDFQSDNYLDQEERYFEKVLENYKKIKTNNFLCCVKINDSTDIMFDKMKTVFPMMTITAQSQPDKLSDLVLFTLRMSVTESKKLKQQMNDEFSYIKADFVKFKLDIITKDCVSDYYWQNFSSFCSTRQGGTGLKVEKKPLSSQDVKQDLKVDKNEQKQEDIKSQTYIFKAFDAINNREVVIKIPKKFVDKKEQITDEDIQAAEAESEIRFYSSSYACQMAYFFNQRLKQYNLLKEMQPLFYAHPILYTLETPFYGMKKIYGETFIQTKKYLFEKYTTNTNFSNQQKYYYSAFSHFSYLVSNKNLVIVDLQGCNNILTDPSIQTKDTWKSILDKDKTNFNDKGIHVFLNSQHQKCSQLCQKLKLDQLNQNSQIVNSVCPPELVKNIYGICYDCDEFTIFESEQFDKVNNQIFKFNCQFCLQYQSEQKTDIQCQCCYKTFFIPVNQQLKKLTNMLHCQECQFQFKCFEKNYMNSCFYCRRKCQKLMRTIKINNQILYICENAHDYLQTFECKKCSKRYNWQSIIDLKDYKEKSYICC